MPEVKVQVKVRVKHSRDRREPPRSCGRARGVLVCSRYCPCRLAGLVVVLVMVAGAGGWAGTARGSRDGHRAEGALTRPGGRRWFLGRPGHGPAVRHE
eukprot:11623204-Alexandrium_andersonii.AAC.1